MQSQPQPFVGGDGMSSYIPVTPQLSQDAHAQLARQPQQRMLHHASFSDPGPIHRQRAGLETKRFTWKPGEAPQRVDTGPLQTDPFDNGAHYGMHASTRLVQPEHQEKRPAYGYTRNGRAVTAMEGNIRVVEGGRAYSTTDGVTVTDKHMALRRQSLLERGYPRYLIDARLGNTTQS